MSLKYEYILSIVWDEFNFNSSDTPLIWSFLSRAKAVGVVLLRPYGGIRTNPMTGSSGPLFLFLGSRGYPAPTFLYISYVLTPFDDSAPESLGNEDEHICS